MIPLFGGAYEFRQYPWWYSAGSDWAGDGLRGVRASAPRLVLWRRGNFSRVQGTTHLEQKKSPLDAEKLQLSLQIREELQHRGWRRSTRAKDAGSDCEWRVLVVVCGGRRLKEEVDGGPNGRDAAQYES